MKEFLTVAAALILSLSARAGDGDKSFQAIAPFLDEATFAVVRVDLAKIDVDAIGDRLVELGLPADQLAEAKKMAGMVHKALRDAGSDQAYAIWSMADRFGEPFLAAPVKNEQAARALSAFMRQSKVADSEAVGSVVLAGNPKTLARLRNVQGQARPDLARALTGDATVQGAFLPPAVLRKSLREAFSELPKELGGGSTRDLEQGFKWAAAGLQITPKFSLTVTVQAKNADAARELKGLFERLLDLAGLQKEIYETIPEFAKIQKLLTPEIKGDRLVLAIDDDAFQKAVKPVLSKTRAAAQRAQDMNNLKQLALAMHNYHDTFRSFPARASFDAQGNPLLSWRVHVLPFIEQEQLYRQFKLDEPWDSEHNKKLIPRMPAVYHSPSQKKSAAGKTCYLLPVGKSAIFSGLKGIKISEILDGTSNTIMIVEVNEENAVPWTKPADFSVEGKELLKRLVRPGAKTFLASFADGSVRAISRTINDKLLRALFTRNGGEVIGDVP